MVEKIKNFEKLDTISYIGLLVLSFAVLTFTTAKLYQVRSSVVKTRQEIASLDNDIKRLDNIVKEREENEDKLRKLTATLPATHHEVAYFTRNLEDIVNAQPQTLEVKIDEKTKDEGSFNSLGFSVTTRGDYGSIKNTLTLLSELPYHTNIDSLKIQLDEAGQLITLTNFRLLMQK